jgi:toxin HigB-1
MRYTLSMISWFADQATALIFSGGFARSLPADIQTTAHRKLKMIDAATSVADLLVPPGNRLEALHGDLSGRWSIRINRAWRICLDFADGEASNVCIVASH